jgi:hypothetical protein
MFPTCPIDRRRPIRRVASTLLLIVITISRQLLAAADVIFTVTISDKHTNSANEGRFAEIRVEKHLLTSIDVTNGKTRGHFFIADSKVTERKKH